MPDGLPDGQLRQQILDAFGLTEDDLVIGNGYEEAEAEYRARKAAFLAELPARVEAAAVDVTKYLQATGALPIPADDGDAAPPLTFTFDQIQPGPTMSIERLPTAVFRTHNDELGAKVEITPEGAEGARYFAPDCLRDPMPDEQPDDWTCPGCGKTWDAIPIGHTWSLRFNPKTLKRDSYTCTDPTPNTGRPFL